MLIGYARVSTDKQDTKLQLDALRRAGCEKIFQEKASGAKAERAELHKALAYAREGDAIVVWKLDRLARSLKQLVEIIDDLRGRGIGFKCLTQDIDTTRASGRLVFGIFASLAEFERELIRERTAAGIEAARAEGRYAGRPPKLTDAQIAELKGRLAYGQPWRAVSREMGISQSTIARYVKGVNDPAIERRRALCPANAFPNRRRMSVVANQR